MADEVYDGAIGIDLGMAHRRNLQPRAQDQTVR
jgi:hypothetical protein